MTDFSEYTIRNENRYMDIALYTSYLIQVLKAAINGQAPTPMPDSIDESLFLRFVDFHKLNNIVYLTIGNNLSADAQKNLIAKYKQSIYVTATQQYYLEAVTTAFGNNDIDYLLLKGDELSKLYPSADMRQSADFDIYLGRKNSKRAKDIMTGLGFSILSYTDTDDHDEYLAAKTAMCEIHPVLIQNDHPWREECNRITDRLLDTDTPHRKAMSYEDFYVYNLAHTAKHMKHSGIGIRAFLDMWLIECKYRDRININRLEEILKRANLFEFYKSTQKLCRFWFEDAFADSLTKEMAEYVAASGWVGTVEMQQSTELAEKAGTSNSLFITKLKTYKALLFVPFEQMCKRYPILKKHKWLLPFYYIKKALEAIFNRRDKFKQVSDNMSSGDIKKGKAILDFKRKIGL